MTPPTEHRPRRLLAVVVVSALMAVPPALLRLSCSFQTCSANGSSPAIAVPFCPLPASLRELLSAGFRTGRSPDVMGVTKVPLIVGSTGRGEGPVWTSLSSVADTRVPIVFFGTGISPDALPEGTGLDQIAPTIAAAIGLRRPHPSVRSGEQVSGVAGGDEPRLVLQIAWSGIGTADLRADPKAWPALRSFIDEGAGTLEGTTGSLPIDPAASLTTIGTGGLPSQHGITGSLIRGDTGDVVAPWSPKAPPSIIATLGDDLDRSSGLASKIGMVEPDTSDRGLIGGTWYPGRDDDSIVLASRAADQTAAVRRMLAQGFGSDPAPDILGIVMQGSVEEMDRELREVMEMARRATNGSVLITVAGTGGSPRIPAAAMSADDLASAIDSATGIDTPLVQAAIPGGVFLDEEALIEAQVSGQVVQKAFIEISDPNGAPAMADAFQAFSVSFGRYC